MEGGTNNNMHRNERGRAREAARREAARLQREYTWHETLKSRRDGQDRRSVRDRRWTDACSPLSETTILQG